MKELSLSDLQRALTECARVTGDREFVIVGSISVLGTLPDAPPALCRSLDIDLFPRYGESGEKNEQIAILFGPGSDFEDENGFYIEGVGRWTMMTALPGWEDRMVPIEAPEDALGWCISPLDLAFVKLEAGREKDIFYVSEMLRTSVLEIEQIRGAIRSIAPSVERLEALEGNLTLALKSPFSRRSSI